MSEKLRPCPWCGQPAVWFTRSNDVECRDRLCNARRESPADWNRRAPTTIEEAMSAPEVRALVETITGSKVLMATMKSRHVDMAPFLAALAAEKEGGR